jgi:hypothetical protein
MNETRSNNKQKEEERIQFQIVSSDSNTDSSMKSLHHDHLLHSSHVQESISLAIAIPSQTNTPIEKDNWKPHGNDDSQSCNQEESLYQGRRGFDAAPHHPEERKHPC